MLIIFQSYGQDQSRADSLKLFLSEDKVSNDSIKLSILSELVRASSAPDDKLLYADKLLKLAGKTNEPVYIITAHLSKGVAYRLKGKLKKSFESLFVGAQLAIDINNESYKEKAFLEIANTYTSNDDIRNALVYEKKAIEAGRRHGEKQPLAINLLNTGYSYYTLNYLDSALLLYNEAEPIFEEIGLEIGKAYTIGNRALVYWKQGDYTKAEKDLLVAVEMLEPLGDQYGMADYHNQLGSIYLEQDNIPKTIWHTEMAIQMGEALGLKEQIRDASLLLADLYKRQDDYKKALEYQTQYLAYKDSIENTEQTKKMADMRTEFEVNLREKEIDLLEEREALQWTYIAIAVGLLIMAIVILLYFRQRFMTTKLMAKAEQKQQNDRIKDLLGSQETKALQAMVKGRDNERRRLAKELHNHFGSLLATLKVNLNGMDDLKSERHKTMTTLVDQACSDIRTMSHSLNMGISENFGLVPALKELTDHLQQSGGLKVEFAAAMGDYQLTSENEIIIYRIVQELVSNVLKHAEATKLSVSLTYFNEESLVNILVQDNGKGFDEKLIEKESDGMGLGTLREMVESFDGDITFDTNRQSGTTVNIDLPFATQPDLTEL
ncbi:Signal transduction histidine kinase [Reichenbachiella faecimaris]|uniref:histidine kinase n=1 Tax=Reichenbachiella faecimaris TaxID=692418 RepID=A0A1W2G8Y9_REIFA|nr:sensor histidine kinase [Reichenbachiella faecimaris]SMD33160.1 Signal transduction histidine kinase [Reichenbachiella faecimaris]